MLPRFICTPKMATAFCVLVLGLAPAALAQAPAPVPGDQRPADRDAIRAHIISIFDAFKKRDRAALRATHAEHWRGYLWGSRTVIKGIDGYMRYVEPSVSGPDDGYPEYELPEFDVLFYGDVAIVNFTANIILLGGARQPWLRITDVYTKQRDGSWMQAASNTDPHPDAFENQMAAAVYLPDSARKELLAAREAVWRTWFAGDTQQLGDLLPADTIAIDAGAGDWPGRDAILESSKQFAAAGNKLVRLEFPKTEIRAYGRTAIIYTTYLFETEDSKGQRNISSGRATEIFVYRNRKWLNPGWHMDSGK